MANMSSMPEGSVQTGQDKKIRRTLSGSSVHSASTSRGAAMQVVDSHVFEYAMGLVIILNVVVMVIETDQTADGGDAAGWIAILSWAVLLTFTLEMLLRLFAQGHSFWNDFWNVMDFFIVAVDASLSVVGLLIGSFFPVSVLRMFRLSKMMRMSKLLRLFPELRVLAQSLAGATRAIGWGLVMVFLILLIWSLIAVVFIHPLAKDMIFDDECGRCHRAYATVFDSMLTLWQSLVVGDGWGSGPVLLIETYPATLFFFIPMFGVIGMAVLNLILGVVVDVSMSAKSSIEDDDDKERKIQTMGDKVQLMELMQLMDENGDGYVSKDEALQQFRQPGNFRDNLVAAEITEGDFELIWKMADVEKKGRLPYAEFIDRLYAVRTSDTHFMLAYIKSHITLIRDDVLRAMQNVENKVDAEEKELHEIAIHTSRQLPLEIGMESSEADTFKIEASPARRTMTESQGVLDKPQAFGMQEVKLEVKADCNSEPSQAWISSHKVLEQCILNLQKELQKVRDSQMELHQFNGVENALVDIQGQLKKSHESQMELKQICTGFRLESLRSASDVPSNTNFSLDGVEAKQRGLKDLTVPSRHESYISRQPTRGSQSIFVQPSLR